MSADYTIKIIIGEDGILRVEESSWRLIYTSLVAQARREQAAKDAAIVRAKKVKLERAIAQAPKHIHRPELVSAARSMVNTLDEVAREIESLNPCVTVPNPVITATDEKG